MIRAAAEKTASKTSSRAKRFSGVTAKVAIWPSPPQMDAVGRPVEGVAIPAFSISAKLIPGYPPKKPPPGARLEGGRSAERSSQAEGNY
jgi:hypothetical protein